MRDIPQMVCSVCGRIRLDVTEPFWSIGKDGKEYCALHLSESEMLQNQKQFLKEHPDGKVPIVTDEWETKIVKLKRFSLKSKENQINALGEIGWQIISVDKGLGYFKRRKVI